MTLSKYLFILLTITLLQACGDGSTSNTPKVEKTKVVHEIQPDKVHEYITNFKEKISQVDFQFEGEKFEISFYDFLQEDKIVIAEYPSGLLFIGFDFEKQQPIASLSVYETNDVGDVQRRLTSSAIEITEQGENYIYSGSVLDASTQGLFSVRLVLNESFFEAGNSTVVVSGTKALINGTLGTKTYIQIDDLIKAHPEVNTLELQQIDGSINDAINMHTGRLIRNAQLTTYIPATGDVNSGGVDLFAAGFKREYAAGGKVGVHSWCCVDGKSAHLLSKDSPEHGAQLTYFREILGKDLGPEFYFFTINAAPADNIHLMTQAELAKYLL